MSNEETGIEVLRSELRNMSDNIVLMRHSIDEMNSELKKIGVLELKHSIQEKSLEEVQEKEEQYQAKNMDDHRKYDKFMWVSTGFIMAISVGWTVLGVYIADSIKDTIKSVSEVKAHMANDRLTDPEEVRKLIKELIRSDYKQ